MTYKFKTESESYGNNQAKSVYETTENYIEEMIWVHSYLEVTDGKTDEISEQGFNNLELSIESAKELLKALNLSIKDYEEKEIKDK